MHEQFSKGNWIADPDVRRLAREAVKLFDSLPPPSAVKAPAE